MVDTKQRNARPKQLTEISRQGFDTPFPNMVNKPLTWLDFRYFEAFTVLAAPIDRMTRTVMKLAVRPGSPAGQDEESRPLQSEKF